MREPKSADTGQGVAPGPPERKRDADPQWCWAAFQPDQRDPWDLRKAAHLHRRAGFGASWPELERSVHDGPQKTVDRLVQPTDDAQAFNDSFDTLEKQYIDPGAPEVTTLREWWLRRMIETPFPLMEKLTLFWHGHFGVSNFRVKSGLLLAQHIRRLRQHALGSFSELLSAVLEDPAVFLGHDAQTNRKAQPRVAFAGTILEQFCLGPGVATENDAREAARAVTGWLVLRNELRYFPHEHDEGQKTILGQDGSWKREDLPRILCGHKATSRHVVRCLYRQFISESETPAETLIEPLAEGFAKEGRIGPLVERMLRSNHFYSQASYRRRVKTPAEFALGIVRAFESLVPTSPLGQQLAELGQELGKPPTSAGWQGGTAWINQGTLIGRGRLAEALLSEEEPYKGKIDPLAAATRLRKGSGEEAGKWLADLLVQSDLPEESASQAMKALQMTEGDPASGLRRLVLLLVNQPEFHLA